MKNLENFGRNRDFYCGNVKSKRFAKDVKKLSEDTKAGPSQAEKFRRRKYSMRNLKRALSLALASVMLLGMMVVGEIGRASCRERVSLAV